MLKYYLVEVLKNNQGEEEKRILGYAPTRMSAINKARSLGGGVSVMHEGKIIAKIQENGTVLTPRTGRSASPSPEEPKSQRPVRVIRRRGNGV